jgi:hypothetical protein
MTNVAVSILHRSRLQPVLVSCCARGAAGSVKRNFALRGEKRLYLIGGLKEPVAVPKKMLR